LKFVRKRVVVLSRSAAVWSIGENAFCKVKAWHEGMDLESKTIAFIREKTLEIPVPNVIHMD
jgi:hypothetical protein